MLAWYFSKKDKRLRYDDGRKIKTGHRHTVSKLRPLKLCAYGLHASERLFDALIHTPDLILWRVRLSGVLQHNADPKKTCAYSRFYVQNLNVTKLMKTFFHALTDEVLAEAKDTTGLKELLVDYQKDTSNKDKRLIIRQRSSYGAIAGFALYYTVHYQDDQEYFQGVLRGLSSIALENQRRRNQAPATRHYEAEQRDRLLIIRDWSKRFEEIVLAEMAKKTKKNKARKLRRAEAHWAEEWV